MTTAGHEKSSRRAEIGKLCEPIPLASQAMLRCLEPNISKHCAPETIAAGLHRVGASAAVLRRERHGLAEKPLRHGATVGGGHPRDLLSPNVRSRPKRTCAW